MTHFTIREVLLVTALAAVALGWWLDRSSNGGTRDEAAPADRHLQLITSDHLDKLLLYDPATGAVWRRYSDGRWLTHVEPLARPPQSGGP